MLLFLFCGLKNFDPAGKQFCRWRELWALYNPISDPAHWENTLSGDVASPHPVIKPQVTSSALGIQGAATE